ncbi:MAG: NAD(P)-dependent alcohol dehydrogenase [Candidatus Hodarchaeales archaeon]|jgi:NADPH:quinone reductase-like Zn-dependent oxidoreductase
MKAIVCEKFGSADVLELKEIEKPTPKDNEVVIRNYASAMQALDITFRSGRKVLSGLFRVMATGIRKPRKKIVGLDFSGEIVSIGKKVTQFKVGDQVYGGTMTGGACAEYVRVPGSTRTAIKPANMSFQEAAAVVGGAIPALFALKNLAKIQSGQKVLINGASGGIGTFAVQIAKNIYETEVTGVCGSSNLNMVSELGADFVIDYTKEDFTKNDQTYDIIFDAVGKNNFSNCKNSLTKKGIYVTVDFYNPKKHLLQLITSKFTSKKIKAGMLGDFDDLNLLREWIEEGKIKSVIEKVYPLHQTADAHRHYETGHAKGRIVITID